MNVRKFLKRENILLTVIIVIFSLYFAVITFFIFTIEPISLFESITQNRLLLLSLVVLFAVMFFLVLYNVIRIIRDRVKNIEGSKFRLRLTLLFLLISLIPIVPLSLISNNMISQSINLWFDRGIEGSLVNALEVSKELYNKLADEGYREWQEQCRGCNPEEMRPESFAFIDGVLRVSHEGMLEPVFMSDYRIMAPLRELHDSEALPHASWKRVMVDNSEYLLYPIGSAADAEVDMRTDVEYFFVRKVPDYIQNYTGTISTGLQSYRTLKIIREPIKGTLILFFLAITMPFVLLSFYLSLIISRQVTVPIQELVRATRRVAEDDLEHSIEVTAKDELRLLIDSFNRMTHDLRVNKELLKHSERSAAWRDIARKIAHEIKNPLTPIKLSAERLLKQYRRDDRYSDVLTKGIETIISEVDSINDMVNEFSDFARFPDTKLEKQDIIAVIDDIIEFLRSSHAGINFHFIHGEERVYLLVDGSQIRRAMLNIIYNSINAIDENGVITIECCPSKGAGADNKWCTIAISDNGIGIDSGIRDRVFDPYFSSSDEGSGLGLAIVEKIVLDNRGRIWFDSAPGKTTFYMEFQTA
jgi:nitrogen fixation/metabolism regulation signal transduction histidine kinase